MRLTWGNQPATAGAAATTPSGTGWRTWNVTSQLQAGYDANQRFGFMIRDATENQGSQRAAVPQPGEGDGATAAGRPLRPGANPATAADHDDDHDHDVAADDDDDSDHHAAVDVDDGPGGDDDHHDDGAPDHDRDHDVAADDDDVAADDDDVAADDDDVAADDDDVAADDDDVAAAAGVRFLDGDRRVRRRHVVAGVLSVQQLRH